MVETTQNHLKISKKKTKKSIKQKVNTDPPWRERERETLPNTKRESYHRKDRTTTEAMMIADGQQWLSKGRKG